MLTLCDTHSHFDAAEFDLDRSKAHENAVGAGVCWQIIPAITAAAWPKQLEICESFTGLYAAFGLHPVYVAEHHPSHLDLLVEWIERHRPVAVGETGLDFFHSELDPHQQRFYFQQQLAIAKKFDLPIIIHARKAVDEVIQSIRQVGKIRGVVHSFGGSEEQAHQLHQLNFKLGIGGPITYSRANRLRRVVAQLPKEQLLLETDSPDQPVCGYQGQRNEPARLLDVLSAVAECRSESMQAVADINNANASQLFSLNL